VVHEFDVTNDTFQCIHPNHTSSVPADRLGHVAETLGHTMYVHGGRSSSTDTFSDLWAFDIPNATWKQLNPTGTSPGPRSYHSMTKLGPYLAIFGGCAVEGRLSDVVLYDPSADRWITVKTQGEGPVPRGGPAAVGLGDTLVVYGGFCGHELGDLWSLEFPEGISGKPLESNVTASWKKVWEVSKDSKEVSSEVPGPRSVMGYTALSEKTIFVFGGEIDPSTKGHEGAGLYSGSSFLWDQSKNQWQKVTDNSNNEITPRGWFECASVSSDTSAKAVVAFGGLDEGNNRRDDLLIFHFS